MIIASASKKTFPLKEDKLILLNEWHLHPVAVAVPNHLTVTHFSRISEKITGIPNTNNSIGNSSSSEYPPWLTPPHKLSSETTSHMTMKTFIAASSVIAVTRCATSKNTPNRTSPLDTANTVCMGYAPVKMKKPVTHSITGA